MQSIGKRHLPATVAELQAVGRGSIVLCEQWPSMRIVPGQRAVKEDPYRRVARLYDRLFEPLNRGLRLIGLRMFRPKAGMRILDVGCGTGVHLDLHRRFGCQRFMSMKGLPTLAAEHDLVIEEQKVVAGGTFALFLVRTGRGQSA